MQIIDHNTKINTLQLFFAEIPVSKQVKKDLRSKYSTIEMLRYYFEGLAG